MTEHDPLARRRIPCPQITVDGTHISCGDCDEIHSIIPCFDSGRIPEPAEVWAERNARIAYELCEMSFVLSNSCDWCRHEPSDCANGSNIKDCITARLIAAEKATEAKP